MCRQRSLVQLSVVLVVAGVVAAGCGGSPPVVTRRYLAAGTSACDRSAPGPLSYHYPVKPFAVQRPIRGDFGDPRTLAHGPFGQDTPHTQGSFAFHNGVDISAPTGTAVYPVVSGAVRIRSGDEVVVVTTDGREFQYFHIRPLVRAGQRVTAYRTVLGRIRPEWHHVHLSEIDLFRVHNPADTGHLTPYRDTTIPVVEKLELRSVSGGALDPSALRGRVEIAAKAADTPPVPVPGAWFGFPVAPALVRWQLTRAHDGVVVPMTTVADFRHTEPPDRDFWRVYAPGTFQNFPVFGHHYFYRTPGRYLFNLTPGGLDTRRLTDGRYVVTVRVADVCANTSLFHETVTVSNHT